MDDSVYGLTDFDNILDDVENLDIPVQIFTNYSVGLVIRLSSRYDLKRIIVYQYENMYLVISNLTVSLMDSNLYSVKSCIDECVGETYTIINIYSKTSHVADMWAIEDRPLDLDCAVLLLPRDMVYVYLNPHTTDSYTYSFSDLDDLYDFVRAYKDNIYYFISWRLHC